MIDIAKVHDALGYADEALRMAAAFREEKLAAARAADAVLPEAVAALIDNGLIEVTDKQAAIAELSDHAKALQVLINLAATRTQSPEPIGRPAGHSKGASAPIVKRTSIEGPSYNREAADEWCREHGVQP